MDRQADEKKLSRPWQHWLLSRNQLVMTAIGTFIVYSWTSNSKFYGLTRIKVQKTIHGSRCFHSRHGACHHAQICTSPLLLLIRECSGEMENREMWVGTQQCGQNMVIWRQSFEERCWKGTGKGNSAGTWWWLFFELSNKLQAVRWMKGQWEECRHNWSRGWS